jgi:NAD(P)-dependent dehydrogenase (short-subunit alcohol dehydrogenase family)
MQLTDRVIVVTGAGNGIGHALCRRFARERPSAIVIADIDRASAERVARDLGGDAMVADVSREQDVQRLVCDVTGRYSRIDLFCSNAGIAVRGGEESRNEDWQRSWDVNVMAHVYAARAALPGMLARGEGYFLHTVSAAGLLTHPHSATYTVTKHGALAFAEWLSIAYGDRGIKVSALCPQGVKTDMLKRAGETGDRFLVDGALEPDDVAEIVVRGLEAERFLILPHPEVAEYARRRAADPDRWLGGMRRLVRDS